MRPADLQLLRVPSEPTMSPDGKLVVVAVSRADLSADAYRSELWLLATDGSTAPRRLTLGPRDTLPRWSPDGRWLAFLRAEDGGKPQIHVLPTAGGEPRRLAAHPLGAGNLTWSPDSTRLAYVAPVPEPGRYGTDPQVPPDKEPPRRVTTRKYRMDNVGYTIDRRSQVFVVDALEGDPRPTRITPAQATPTQITSGDFDAADPAWSPDGTRLAFVSARHADRDRDNVVDVFIAPVVAGAEPHRVTRGEVAAGRPTFTPEGERLCFLSPSAPDDVARNRRLWLVPADGSAAAVPLTDRERWHLETYGVAPTHPLLVSDGDALTVAENRGAIDVVRVPLHGGEPQIVLGGPRQVVGMASAAGTTVVVATSDTSAGEVFSVRPDSDLIQLSDFGAALREGAPPRRMLEVAAEASDGYPVHGWVVKPAGDGPFPVLLNIHGGPFTQYGWTLLDEAQVYAGAGYAVVMGNPRGASGYGEAHGRAIVGDLGNLDRQDLLALLDAALTDPGLDGNRVGVLGGSYGGFMTTWLIGDSDRFRAAISERAVNAWDSFAGSSDIGWFFSDAYCGRDAERQRAQSPLYRIDGATTPTLIVHSEQDWRCPLEQAQRLFERLQRQGTPVQMLIFPGESHELSRSGLPSHRVARFQAILDWFDRHLRQAPAEAVPQAAPPGRPQVSDGSGAGP